MKFKQIQKFFYIYFHRSDSCKRNIKILNSKTSEIPEICFESWNILNVFRFIFQHNTANITVKEEVLKNKYLAKTLKKKENRLKIEIKNVYSALIYQKLSLQMCKFI